MGIGLPGVQYQAACGLEWLKNDQEIAGFSSSTPRSENPSINDIIQKRRLL
jgi:hypothetical protein